MYWCWWYLVYAYTYKQNRTACQHSRPLKYITSWHFKCHPTLLMHTHKIQWIFTLRTALLWTSVLSTNKIQWIFTPRPALLWTSAILKCHVVVISNISGRCRVITFESDIMMFRIVWVPIRATLSELRLGADTFLLTYHLGTISMGTMLQGFSFPLQPPEPAECAIPEHGLDMLRGMAILEDWELCW